MVKNDVKLIFICFATILPRNIENFSDVKLLQEKVMQDLDDITKQMKSRLPYAKACWTRRNDLGCVFSDIDESDEFVNTFSSYLYGITIVTYDQLLETTGIVTALQGKNNNNPIT